MTVLIFHFVLLAWLSQATAKRLVGHWRERILAAVALFWGNIVASSLLLSLLGKLGEPDWFFRHSLILGAVTLGLISRFVAPPAAEPAPAALADPAGRPDRWLLVGALGTLFLLLLVNIRVAYAYPPNNYDSLAYHLPRVMYYMGHNTLAQFESADIRQVYFTFNYNLLQLLCLVYSPPLESLNFINVLFWPVAGLGVYHVSRRCGCSGNASLIAAWLALTTTQVLAQATTITLDLSTSAMLFVAVSFGLRWRQDHRTRDAVLAGLAAGLAGGAKLTVVFFGPTVVFLLAVFLYQHGREGRVRGYLDSVRAWLVPGLLAAVLAVPFIIYNLAATGHWMTDKLDFTLNKPFSLACAWQTSRAYLFQLFFEPFGRFSYDLNLIGELNEWFRRVFFQGWNQAYAYSGFFVIPPDLNEDHVWYGFSGPFFLVCGIACLWRDRRLQGPLAWLALLGLGWFATYFAMNKWSLYTQRYFLLAIMLMAPCAAAVWDGGRPGARLLGRARRLAFAAVAATSAWFALSYLDKNHNRPFYLPSSAFTPPRVLPEIPPTLARRLAEQSRINVISDGTNERIYVLMHFAPNQRFTSSQTVDPEKYNLFSYWSFTRNNIYANIAHVASHTIVPVPEKKTAGVQFLGTIGTGVDAFDYVGMVPHANDVSASSADRNISVLVYYGPTEPDRFAHCRLRVEGLNPHDGARVEITAEMADGTVQPLMAQAHSGSVKFSLHQPFKRLAILVVDATTGRKLGAGELPVAIKPEEESVAPPVAVRSLFSTEFISSDSPHGLTSTGLANLEGPYAQWGLPSFRWAKQPVVHIEVPANPKLKRLQLTFDARLQVREQAHLLLLHNHRIVQEFTLQGREAWHAESLDLPASAGVNVIELRDAPLDGVPDWLAYLDQNPDVKAQVLAEKKPLEAGAQEHYESHGRKEGRLLPVKAGTVPSDSLYFIYRTLQVQGFTN